MLFCSKTCALLIQVSVDHENQHEPMFKEVWLCNFKFGQPDTKKTIPNDNHVLISPLVLAVHSRETSNDSNETRCVSRET